MDADANHPPAGKTGIAQLVAESIVTAPACLSRDVIQPAREGRGSNFEPSNEVKSL